MQRAGSTAGTRQRMGVQDALWLEMDRPTNLMVVDSLFWTTEPIDWDRFTEVVRERLWDRYRVFRSIAVHDHDGWHWEERPGEALESHITHVRLAEPGDGRVLRELVASQRTVPLDRDRPLWQVVCIDGFGDGSAVLSRTHHAIADGIRMVQLAMSLFDATPDGGAILPPPAPPCTANPTAGSLADRARSQLAAVAGDVAGEVAHLAGQVAGAAAGAVGHAVTHPLGTARSGLDAVARAAGGAVAGAAALTTASVTNPVGAAHGTAVSTSAWLQRALRPTASGEGPIVDLLAAGPGDLDIARKLLLGTLNDPTIWTGRVGTRKEVAWSEPLPLDEVKAVARAHDATVNDVLVTCVAGTLHHYLTRHDAQCASVNWMIPVNLKALDLTLPEKLGNEFAIVQLELPTGVADPVAVLDVVKHRMGRIKHGHEAAIAFRLQELISGFSDVLYRATVDLLANRAVGVLTNVPGPPMPVHIAGVRVEGMVGWAPLSGDQPMSFTIYSYDGKVFVGIACDAGLVPDHEQIVDGFADAFRRLAVAVR